MAKDERYEYIEEQLRQGKTKLEIANELRISGWKDKEIKEAFEAGKVKEISKTGLEIIRIFLVVVVIALIVLTILYLSPVSPVRDAYASFVKAQLTTGNVLLDRIISSRLFLAGITLAPAIGIIAYLLMTKKE